MGGVCPGRTRKSEFRDSSVGHSGNIGRRKTVVAEEVVVAVEEEEHEKEVIHEYPIPNHEMNSPCLIPASSVIPFLES